MRKICAYAFGGVASCIVLLASYFGLGMMVLNGVPAIAAWIVALYATHLALSFIEKVTEAWAGEAEE